MTSGTPIPRPQRLFLALVAAVGLAAPAVVAVGAAEASAEVSAEVSREATAGSRLVPAQRYVTATVDKKHVRKGRRVTISGAVEAPDAPWCAAGVVLNVERSTHGAVYDVVDTVTTDAAGRYAVREKVRRKARFRISAPATDACSSLQSPPRTVDVIR